MFRLLSWKLSMDHLVNKATLSDAQDLHYNHGEMLLTAVFHGGPARLSWMSSIHQVHRYSDSTYGMKLINDVYRKDLLRFDWEKASQIDSGGIKYQQETAIHSQARRLSVSEKFYTAPWRSSFFSPPCPFIVFSEDAAKQIWPVASRDLPLHRFKDWYVSMEYGYQDSSFLELPSVWVTWLERLPRQNLYGIYSNTVYATANIKQKLNNITLSNEIKSLQ